MNIRSIAGRWLIRLFLILVIGFLILVIGSYLIGLLILLVSPFLPSSLLSRLGDPGDLRFTLRFVGWWLLTAICGMAIVEILKIRNKWWRLLAVPPGAVLAYVGWYILKRIVLGVIGFARDPASVWTTLFLIWIFATWWLWEERRQYKEDLKLWRERTFQQQPSRCPHCGAQL